MHSQSRFLVLRSSLDLGSLERKDKTSGGEAASRNLGYAVVRFDTEDTARGDDDAQCDVLYW